MKSLKLSRCTLSVCVAAALLAGCGGSQGPGYATSTGMPPTLGPNASVERALAAKGSKSWYLYVADFVANRVEILNSRYKMVRSISRGLSGPVSDWVDGHGNLYVANTSYSGSRRGKCTGYVQQYAPRASAPMFTYSKDLTCPLSVSVDANGLVYVYDAGFYINVYRSGVNKVIRRLKFPQPPKFTSYSASALITDASGDLFATVSAHYNKVANHFCYANLYEFSSGKSPAQYLNGGPGCGAPGLAFDTAGNLLMANTGGGYVACDGGTLGYAPPYTAYPYLVVGGDCTPVAVALAPDQKTMFIASYPDYGSGSVILVYSYPDATLRTTLGAQSGLTEPVALAIGFEP